MMGGTSRNSVVVHMSEKCLNCDIELNEELECPRCGLTADTVSFEETEATSVGDSSAASLHPDDLSLEAALSSEDPAELATQRDLVPEHNEPSYDLHEFEDSDDLSGWNDEVAPDNDDVADILTADEAEDPEAGGSTPISPGLNTDISLSEHARLRDLIVAPGSTWMAPQPKEQDDKSLIEFTQPLPPKSPSLPKLLAEESSEYVEKLREQHLVLIDCPDEDIALAAAHALIEGLNLPRAGTARLLNFDRSVGEGSQPSIYNLRKKSKSDHRVAVLADAATESARQFLEPIITVNRFASEAIQDDLRRNDMYMICMVNLAALEDLVRFNDRARELKFPCWRLPFLSSLLERYDVAKPEKIETQIDEQRKLGWWSPNDSEFYFKLKTLLVSNELSNQIDSNMKAPPVGPVDKLFKGDQPLQDTVLYVATFFPNLTPYEFNQLVPVLLSPAGPNGAAGNTNGGANDASLKPTTNSALHDWRTRPDQILRQCNLVSVPVRDATKGVSFTNHTIRDNLRTYLEREYSLFLENRFQDVQELGLLFSPSAKTSQGAMQMILEMAVSYPEYYGSKWLATLVTDFEAVFAGTENTRAKTWAWIDETTPAGARKRFYQTLADLIRAMLEPPRLSDLVEEFLRKLLLSKHHDAVLEIVRRLQFAPAFDQFKWLKQLFHQGNQQTRTQAAEYLRAHLKRMGARVYQALKSLKSWLPEADNRSQNSYPIPARIALRLVYFYFSETTFRFDQQYFGAWPSSHPLFAFADAGSAADNLRLLVSWLFHPGMKTVFTDQRGSDERGTVRFNNLLTHWFFILNGRGDGSSQSIEDQTTSGASFGAHTVRTLLLQEIVRAASAAQQIGLLDHWREQSQATLRMLSNKSYSSPERDELAWKRDLLVELIASYEKLLLAQSLCS